MKKRKFRFLTLLASILGILSCACNDNSTAPSKVSVNKEIVAAIYSTVEKGGSVDTISPCLLKETVHISELLHYPNDKGITMPFNFTDTVKYAEITEANLNKRIAICLNGKVMSTPVVKMKLDNGACSVELNDEQALALFPNVNMKELNSTYN